MTCREHQSRTPELPRLKRLFTGRRTRASRHRIQRSLSLRVPSSTRSQPTTSGVRSFATQSFSGVDKVKVERVMPAAEAATPIVMTTRFVSTTTSLVSYSGVHLFTHRSISVSSPPVVNGRLLHETGQTLDEPPYW